jgi:atlastin
VSYTFTPCRKFFLLYRLILSHQYKSINTLYDPYEPKKSGEWIGEPDEPLKGFSWKPGVIRNTTGIVLWSDVFLYDSPRGEKYAILLVDTQGLFDHDTPPSINSKIFSFTTLITSSQIFNLANLIQEDHLEYFKVLYYVVVI